MKKRSMSLKQRMVVAIVFILIPVTAAFLFFINKTVLQVQEQMSNANAAALQVYYQDIQTELQYIEQFVNSDYWTATITELVQQGTIGEEQAESIENVNKTIETVFSINRNVTAFIEYNPSTQYYAAQFNNTVGYGSVKNQLREEILKLLQSNMQQPSGWFVWTVGERNFLIRITNAVGMYTICFYDFEILARNARTIYSMNGTLLFIKNGQSLTNQSWVQENKVEFLRSAEKYYLAGKRKNYLINQKVGLAGITVAYATPYNFNLNGYGFIYWWPLVFFTAVVVGIAGVYFYLRKNLFVPLYELEQNMQQIKQGDMSIRQTNFKSPEFAQVNETFNEMLDKIQKLRIEAYERQLETERAQLDALRMQIRPHFFLNCLKSLYGMAEAGKHTAIQNMILYLSPHLRYVLDIESNSVPLDTELQMCKNYISLQAASESGKPKCEISIDANLTKIKVPPVSLLTVVENCVKHGMSQDGQLTVTISVRSLFMDGDTLADIIITDNGPGFSKKQLITLNSNIQKPQDGNNIGIYNVIRRFQLLYGDGVAVQFSNKNGAQVEFIIAIKEKKSDETIDC